MTVWPQLLSVYVDVYFLDDAVESWGKMAMIWVVVLLWQHFLEMLLVTTGKEKWGQGLAIFACNKI